MSDRPWRGNSDSLADALLQFVQQVHQNRAAWLAESESESPRADAPTPPTVKPTCDTVTGASVNNVDTLELDRGMVWVEPEIARLAMAAESPALRGRADKFLRLWLVLRKHAAHNGGPGWLSVDDFYNACVDEGLDHTRRYINYCLVRGRGLFWRISEAVNARQERRLYLISGEKLTGSLMQMTAESDVYPALVNLPGVREVAISLGDGLQEFRANLMGAWFTHRESPTIARDTLRILFNRATRQTFINYDAHIEIEITKNHAQALQPGPQSDESILDGYGAFVPDGAGAGFNHGDQPMAIWQIANTYNPRGFRQRAYAGKARARRDAALSTGQQILETQPGFTWSGSESSGADYGLCVQHQRGVFAGFPAVPKRYWTSVQAMQRAAKRAAKRGENGPQGLVFVGVKHGRGIWALHVNQAAFSLDTGLDSLTRGRIASAQHKRVLRQRRAWQSGQAGKRIV